MQTQGKITMDITFITRIWYICPFSNTNIHKSKLYTQVDTRGEARKRRQCLE